MFKKKEALVKDGASDDVNAKKAEKRAGKTPKSGKRSRPGKSIYSWTFQPALITLLVLIAAYFVIDQFSLAKSEAEFNASMSQQRLSSLSNHIDSYVDSLKQSVSNLAIRGTNQSSLTNMDLQKVWPELTNYFQVSGANLDGARQAYPQLTFASVDLLRRALQQQKTIVEPFFHEDKWLIQIAAPVLSEVAKTSSGDIVLAVFDLSAVESIMKSSEAMGSGELALVSSANRALLSMGKGLSSHKVKDSLSVPGLSVTYAPRVALTYAIDRMMLLIILVAVGALIVLVNLLIARVNMGRIRKDVLQVSSVVAKQVSGSKKVGSFTHGEFLAMSQAVSEQVKQLLANVAKAETSAKKANAKQKEVESKAENEVDDAPLFDDDILDLDVLNDQAEEMDADLLDEPSEMLSELKGLDIDVPQSIFRAYDIRGIVDQTLSEGIVELIGKAIASEAILQGQKAICIGFDARHSSIPYSEALMRGILSTGLDVLNIGEVPTPVLYFATHHFNTGSGVMITGSHNPANYNGFKIMLDGKTLSGEEIQKLYNRILLQDFENGEGTVTECDVSQEYMDTILNDIAVAAPLKVVLDCGNGVAGRLAPQLIEELGCEVIPLHCEVDGNFPNHHPDPSRPENLSDLISAVQEHDADIGLAFDGDADRLGVVTNTGKIIWPDRLLMLFAKDVVSRNPGADILFDVKCSRRLNSLISSYGGRPVMWKSGHSFMKAKMRETGALLAGEMSGHVFFKERWFGFDDGLYAAARLLEVLGVEDRASDEVFADFPEDISTPEINIAVTDESKFTIVEKLCLLKGNFVGGNATTVDGLRVEYPNGWGLCRASNTTPALVLRFEADDESALEEIKSEFRQQLQAVDASLVCEF